MFERYKCHALLSLRQIIEQLEEKTEGFLGINQLDHAKRGEELAEYLHGATVELERDGKIGTSYEYASLESEVHMPRICGTCTFANPKLNSSEIQFLQRLVNFHQKNAILLLKATNHFRGEKVRCRRESMEVSVSGDACAFWKQIK